MKDIFEPIDSEEFKNIKKRIEKVRKEIIKNRTFQNEYKEVKSIRLQALLVENISLVWDTSSCVQQKILRA
ncbi:MAG: hypothetical protein IPJ40_07760 [Saprospirales bacterium]|nr:hypothetical protein [Saprospirales bacterium]